MRVVITGSAKRIGAALVRAFATAGYDVVIHCNTSVCEGERLLSSIKKDVKPPARHQLIVMDLTAENAVSRFFDEVLSTGEAPDILINNASCYERLFLGEETSDEFQRQYRINFLVPYELMKEYHRRCVGGLIINMLDYRVKLADPASGGYALAKKSLCDVTEAAAVQWPPAFRVNGIAPGIVRPADGVPLEKMERLIQRVPTRRRTYEEEIARAALAIADIPSMNGQILYLDGGAHLLGGDALCEASGASPCGRRNVSEQREGQQGR